MHRRHTRGFQPDLETFRSEATAQRRRRAPVAHHDDGVTPPAVPAAETSHPHAAARHGSGKLSSLPTHFLAYRITNPKTPVNLIPPFQQVLVQHTQPVPGQVYNVLYIAVKNGTSQTFTASNGFTVRLPGTSGGHRVIDDALPVLTGDQQWKPGQWTVFYVLSKQYYPLSPQVAAGFQLDAGGGISTMIPGPSGIFLRVTYDPATFARHARLDRGPWPRRRRRRGCETGPARYRHQRTRGGPEPS